MRPHGYARYRIDGCRCNTCGWAVSEYERDRQRQITAGTWTVDTGPVVAHLRSLRAAGMGRKRIAAAAGVAGETVLALLLRPRPTIRKPIADRLLAVQPDPAPSALVPALGSARRARALAAIGHSLRWQAAQVGWEIRNYYPMARDIDGQVMVQSARAVAELFERWHMTPATRKGATTARNRARALGWAPPLAWDDIDDPDAKPRGVRRENGVGCEL